MRVVIFHRGTESSTDISQQLRDHCATAGNTLMATYAPPVGERLDSTQLREQFNQMRDMFASPQGRPAVILIPDATHLADSLEQLVRRLLHIQRLNCDARCADDNFPDPLQSGANLLGLAGRLQGSGTQIRSALVNLATNGKVLGRTPYGYSKGDDQKLKINPLEAGPIISMFDQCATGSGLRRITRSLREKGYATRSGKAWSQVAVANLLRNRVYIGTYMRCGVRIVGNHPPLVDTDVFRMAGEKLSGRKNNAAMRKEYAPYPLSGLLRCATCNTPLSGISRHRRWRTQDGALHKCAYRYYECPTVQNGGGSEHSSINAKKLHTHLERWLTKHRIGSLKQSRANYLKTLKKQHLKRVGSIEKSFRTAYKSLLEGRGVLSDIEPLLIKLNEQRRQFETHPNLSDISAADMLSQARQLDGTPRNVAALNATIKSVTVGRRGVPKVVVVGSSPSSDSVKSDLRAL